MKNDNLRRCDNDEKKGRKKCDTKDYFQIISSCWFFISIFLYFGSFLLSGISLNTLTMTNISTAHQKKAPTKRAQNQPHSLTPKILVGIPFISELIIKCISFVQIFSQHTVTFLHSHFIACFVETRVICFWHNYKLSTSSFLALFWMPTKWHKTIWIRVNHQFHWFVVQTKEFPFASISISAYSSVLCAFYYAILNNNKNPHTKKECAPECARIAACNLFAYA